MRKAKYIVSGKDVQAHTAALLEQKAGLQPTKGKCTLAILIHLVCAAAARLTSLYDACSQMNDAPSGEATRNGGPVKCERASTSSVARTSSSSRARSAT